MELICKVLSLNLIVHSPVERGDVAVPRGKDVLHGKVLDLGEEEAVELGLVDPRLARGLRVKGHRARGHGARGLEVEELHIGSLGRTQFDLGSLMSGPFPPVAIPLSPLVYHRDLGG